MSETERNKAVADRFLTLFSTQRLDEAFDLLCDDMTWTMWGSGTGTTDYTKAGMKQLLIDSWQWFEGPVSWLPEEMIAEEDRVAVVANSQATTKDGYRHGNHYHNMFRFRDGKIACIREMFPEPPVRRLFAHLTAASDQAG